MASAVPTKLLNSGATMPTIGLGTWKSKAGAVENAVKIALRAGYRHIDCAAVYGNEVEVGSALAETLASSEGKAEEGKIPRSEVFITSKLWNTDHHPDHVKPALQETLKNLQLDYLDLYLIHWPQSYQHQDDGNRFPTNEDGSIKYSEDHYLETWKALEACVEEGLVKSIGLSNFNSVQIQEIWDACKIKPAVLQVESSPYLDQTRLLDFVTEKGIVMTGYSPLGSPDRPWAKPEDPKLMDDPKVVAIAERVGKTPAQVLIKYQLARGIITIPKSVTESRIIANFDVFNFDLTEEDIATLKSFNIPFRACAVDRDASHPYHPFFNGAEF